MAKIYIKEITNNGHHRIKFLINEEGQKIVRIDYLEKRYNIPKQINISDLLSPETEESEYYFRLIENLRGHLKGLGYKKFKFMIIWL